MSQDTQLKIANSTIDWGALGVTRWNLDGMHGVTAYITVPGRDTPFRVSPHHDMPVEKWPAMIMQAKATAFLRPDVDGVYSRMKEYDNVTAAITKWELVYTKTPALAHYPVVLELEE